jgi:hypothetical protein
VFVRSELEFELQQENGIRFDVEVLTPTSVKARPTDFSVDTPGFSLIGERRNFKMHVRVVFDPFAGQLKSAIKAGHTNNPGSLKSATRALAQSGWTSHIRIDDSSLNISANHDSVFESDPGEIVRSSVEAMTILCQFTLGFYVLTKPLEFRSATMRDTNYGENEHSVWEYDPSERDRSTLQHRALENWLIDQLRDANIEPLDSVRGPQFDVAWQINGLLIVCEVKSTRLNEIKQIRLGIGQVLHYRLEAAQNSDHEVVAALLVERPPVEPVLEELCRELRIQLFWPSDDGIPLALRRAPSK